MNSDPAFQSIRIFEPRKIFSKTDSKISAVDHLCDDTFIIGDKKGCVYVLKNNFGGKEAVLIHEPVRITKTNVRKLVTLSQERLLVAAMSDENLYLIDLSKKEFILQTKSIKNFSYYPGELRPDGRSKIFVVT
jgi:hypothetical protein